MSIVDDLQESIAANLPAAVASELSKYLETAEKQSQQIESMTKAYDEVVDANMKKGDEIADLKNKITQQDILDKQERDLADKEELYRVRKSELNVEILEIKLEESTRRNALIENLVGKVFGHPSVTISNTKDVPIMTSGNDSYVPYESGRTSEHNTTVTSESKS